MVELGYSLSAEEHSPRELVRQAVAAEEAGFSFALVSDHFHPWTNRQGQSPFVWSVIGAIAQATERLRGRIGDALIATPPNAEHAEQVAEPVVCGPDLDRHREAIHEFEQAGFDHVYVHQVGPDQEGFLRFYEQEILATAAVG